MLVVKLAMMAGNKSTVGSDILRLIRWDCYCLWSYQQHRCKKRIVQCFLDQRCKGDSHDYRRFWSMVDIKRGSSPGSLSIVTGLSNWQGDVRVQEDLR